MIYLLTAISPLFDKHSFIPVKDTGRFNSVGTCLKLSPQVGGGYYWIYSKQNLYDVKIHDFFFHEDSFMEFDLPSCLSITQYESISGEELSPYRRLSADCIKTFVGGYEPYKVLIHKKIPIRAIGIEIMPAYYEDYLKTQYPDDYASPLPAFKQIDQVMEFPEMARLLHNVKTYRGDGIAASLFYKAKIAEAVSLIVDAQQKKCRVENTCPVKILLRWKM